MAKNIKQGGLNLPINHVGAVVTVPTSNTSTVIPKSGTPCLVGRIPGVAHADIDTATGLTTVVTNCIADLSVVAVDETGVSAVDANNQVNAHDLIYMGSDGRLSKRTDGTPFGTAWSSVSNGKLLGANTKSGKLIDAGATVTIQVWVGKIN